MDVRQVIGSVSELLLTSLAPSTMTGYARAWTLLGQCMHHIDIPFHGISSLPLSSDLMLMFIGYLHLINYAPASIVSYVSAISYVHKIKNLPDPTSLFVVQRLLSAITKTNQTTDPRLPITLDILTNIITSLQHTDNSHHNQCLLRAMFTVAFFGLMRIGEITSDAACQAAVNFNQLSFHEKHAILNISQFKHNSSSQPFQIVLPEQKDRVICPLDALRKYISLRGNSHGPLFCFQNMHPVSRNYFVNKLNIALSYCGLSHNSYKSHSFRIGAASYYASTGLSDEQIRLLGRWRSNAFRRYIRCQRIISALPE